MAVVAIILQYKIHAPMVKLMFSQEATKIDEIFIVDLTLCNKCQIGGEVVNFRGFLRKYELYPFIDD